MVYVPVSNTAQAEIRYTYGTEKFENTLYFQRSQAIDQTAMQALADYVAQFWYDELRPFQISSVVLREVFVTDLTTQTSGVAVSLLHEGVAGAYVGGTALPVNVTASIAFRTASRGRSYRGRNYIVGMSTAQISGNNLTAQILADYTAAYEALITTPLATWTWVVVSRFSNGSPRTNGVATPIVSCGFADQVLDSQRRRLPGRGQ